MLLVLAAFVVALLFFTGCQSKLFTPVESKVDKNWGKAYEAAKHNQILNPEAQKNEAPVVGLDGETAEKNMDVYRNSSEKAEPEPKTNFRIQNMTVK